MPLKDDGFEPYFQKYDGKRKKGKCLDFLFSKYVLPFAIVPRPQYMCVSPDRFRCPGFRGTGNQRTKLPAFLRARWLFIIPRGKNTLKHLFSGANEAGGD